MKRVMMLPHRLLLVVMSILLLPLLVPTNGFKYDLDIVSSPDDRFAFTELFMFGTNQGPTGNSKGSSYIETDLHVVVEGLKPGMTTNYSIVMLFYRAEGVMEDRSEQIDLCDPAGLMSRSQEVRETYQDVHRWETWLGRPVEGRCEGNLLHRYDVINSGLNFVELQLCPMHSADDARVSITGDIAFKNPYGYLPGVSYGYLPFEGLRFSIMVVVLVAFCFFLMKQRNTALPLHWAIMSVLVLGTIEALAWLAVFIELNDTGMPYCCPFPAVVIASVSLEVLRELTSRCLMLLVCLGYGITRVSLSRNEWLLVNGLNILFLASKLAYQAAAIETARHLDDGQVAQTPIGWVVPAIVIDLVYILWIYGALVDMLRQLKDESETVKYKMYQRLSTTIGTALWLAALLAILFVWSQVGVWTWQWRWLWVGNVAWQVLNALVLIMIAFIWCPNERSAQLAYSRQLSTDENDTDDASHQRGDGDDDGDEGGMGDGVSQIQMVQVATAPEAGNGRAVTKLSGPARKSHFAIMDEEDDEEEEEEEAEEARQRAEESKWKGGGNKQGRNKVGSRSPSRSPIRKEEKII